MASKEFSDLGKLDMGTNKRNALLQAIGTSMGIAVCVGRLSDGCSNYGHHPRVDAVLGQENPKPPGWRDRKVEGVEIRKVYTQFDRTVDWSNLSTDWERALSELAGRDCAGL